MHKIIGLLLRIPLKLLGKLINFLRKQILGGQVLLKRGDVFYIPLWIPAMAVSLIILSFVWDDVRDGLGRVHHRVTTTITQLIHHPGNGEIASFFAPAVQHWSGDIVRWSELYEIQPQLMATIMQIESCGHPTVVSSAGARGLFQVMPFHFEAGEDMVHPDTNAKRGGLFMNYCYKASNGDVGLTLACYNGGPSVINRPLNTWASETQRYYRWGVGIYSDAIVNRPTSDTLNQWMDAGGSGLCASALDAIRNYTPSIAMQPQS